jgi:cardiolipin synthase
VPLKPASGAIGWSLYAEGDAFFPAMLAAIAAARFSVRLETYIFQAAGIGLRVLDALTQAAQRGARVRVLVDGFGSNALPDSFWAPLRNAGGEVRVFNPLRINRLGIRDHRKLVVCDDAVAFVGGYNIAPNYEGNGVERGWHDVALRVQGPLAEALGSTFDRLYSVASFRRKPFMRLRRGMEKRVVEACGCVVLLGGPGRGGSPLLKALRRDLARARSVQIMVAYFLPTRRLRLSLARAARRGALVELILPGESDVALSKLATESVYRRLLRAGICIREYQPQMLHGKLFVIDDVVYVGSSNLDPRSLRLNYELTVRLEGRDIAEAARSVFAECGAHSQPVDQKLWRHERSLWTRVKQRFAHFVMARLDPWLALAQWRSLPD